jgi:hypothetical protein
LETISRADKQEFLREVQAELSTTTWAKGIPGVLPGARPAQLRAGARILMQQTMAKMRRLDREAVQA